MLQNKVTQIRLFLLGKWDRLPPFELRQLDHDLHRAHQMQVRCIFTNAAQHSQTFPRRGRPEGPVAAVRGRDRLQNPLFQTLLVERGQFRFAEHGQKIALQRIVIVCQRGFLDALRDGRQPLRGETGKTHPDFIDSFDIQTLLAH